MTNNKIKILKNILFKETHQLFSKIHIDLCEI